MNFSLDIKRGWRRDQVAPTSSSDVCDPHAKPIVVPFAYMAHNAMYALRAGTERFTLTVPRDGGPSFDRLQDPDMLVISGGRERTEVEYRALFDAAGLKRTRIVLTLFPVSLIEGMRK